MSETPFNVDTYPTAELSDSIIAAAKSVVECDLVKAGILAGTVIRRRHGTDAIATLICPPDTLKNELDVTIARLEISKNFLTVRALTSAELAAQKKADIAHIDYELQRYDRP